MCYGLRVTPFLRGLFRMVGVRRAQWSRAGDYRVYSRRSARGVVGPVSCNRVKQRGIVSLQWMIFEEGV